MPRLWACHNGERERVFFIAHRKDLNFKPLKLQFKEAPILFREIRSKQGKDVDKKTKSYYLLQHRKPTDKCMADINLRLNGKGTNYGSQIYCDEDVAQTLVSSGTAYRMVDGKACTDSDFINMQTFPQDYDFGKQQAKYICGMSVPPVMMAQISAQIYEQWFKPMQ